MNENNLVAYKFTDKGTGEVKYGRFFKSDTGFDVFRVISVEEVNVPNPDATGSTLENEKYTLELVEGYKGVLPSWEIEI